MNDYVSHRHSLVNNEFPDLVVMFKEDIGFISLS